MRFVLFFLVLSLSSSGCKDKDLSSKHLTRISVVREAESPTPEKESTPTTPSSGNSVSVPVSQQPPAQYHIIVASFSTQEKARAEKMLSRLKAKNYPATLLYSSNRYRLSIECFSSEAEANAARDEYRTITDRQDIWVHKVN
ncbi:MAG: SPOR domain-containing protein [Odoribacter sp.]|nr:SPOR domain-containing protein [Odoribacter sp.]